MKLLPLALALLPSAAASHSHGPARGLLGLGGCMESRPVPPSTEASTLSGCSGDKLVSASLDKRAVEKGGEVTLTWSGAASHAPSTSDWLGFFCSDDLASLGDTEYFDYRYLTAAEAAANAGSLTTALLSGREDACEFRFFTSGHCEIGESPPVKIVDAKTAVGSRHLALTGDGSEMRVSWTSGSRFAPSVSWGAGEGSLGFTAGGSCRTYGKEDMCEAPANAEAGFVDPGWLCSAVMTGLAPDATYYYKVTSDGSTFSEETRFQAAPPADDPDYSFSFIAYGDMGTWSGTDGAASVATASISEAEVELNGARRIDRAFVPIP